MSKAKFLQISTTHYASTHSISIRMKHGWNGYGLYIAIIQFLADNKDRVLTISEIPQIAFQLQVDPKLIEDIINNYMTVDDTVFSSDELEELLKKFDSSSLGGKTTATIMTKAERIERARKGAYAKHKIIQDKTEIRQEEIIQDKTEIRQEEIIQDKTEIRQEEIIQDKTEIRQEEIIQDKTILDNMGASTLLEDTKQTLSRNLVDIQNTNELNLTHNSNPISHEFTSKFFEGDSLGKIIQLFLQFNSGKSKPMPFHIFENRYLIVTFHYSKMNDMILNTNEEIQSAVVTLPSMNSYIQDLHNSILTNPTTKEASLNIINTFKLS